MAKKRAIGRYPKAFRKMAVERLKRCEMIQEVGRKPIYYERPMEIAISPDSENEALASVPTEFVSTEGVHLRELCPPSLSFRAQFLSREQSVRQSRFLPVAAFRVGMRERA